MKRVVIADDAMFMRISLRTILQDHGYEIAGEAGNGREAVQLFRDTRPDLVTLDITMPECDGLEALREIMAIDPRASVIMISATGQEKYMREALLNGAKTFIVKPFSEACVVRALRDIAQAV